MSSYFFRNENDPVVHGPYHSSQDMEAPLLLLFCFGRYYRVIYIYIYLVYWGYIGTLLYTENPIIQYIYIYMRPFHGILSF